MDTIAKQKALAERIYGIVKNGEGLNILLAGGAPRDWYVDKVANDLDFYIQTDNWLRAATQVADALEVDLRQKGGDEYDKAMREASDLHAVLETEMYGQTIQFMFVTCEPKEFVQEKFDLSICKVWYENQEIDMNWEARLSIRERVIVNANGGYSPRVGKLLAREEWGDFALKGDWDAALKWMAEGNRHQELRGWRRPRFAFNAGGVALFDGLDDVAEVRNPVGEIARPEQVDF